MTKFEKANQRALFYFELMYRVEGIKDDKRRLDLDWFIYQRYCDAINDCLVYKPELSEQPLPF